MVNDDTKLFYDVFYVFNHDLKLILGIFCIYVSFQYRILIEVLGSRVPAFSS